MKKDFYNQTINEVEKNLNTSFAFGLNSHEVRKRQAEYGFNEFAKKRHTTTFTKFLMQFKSFMIIVLIIAAMISGIIGYLHGEGFTDAIIILAIVIVNAFIGVIQENKAERSMDALEKLSSPHSKVIRDGHLSVVPSRELVFGDVVVIETGDAIPADLRLIESFNLKVQEAALTGESVPEEKYIEPIEGEVGIGDRDNMAYSSTTVTYGRGKGVVTATGMNSEVGKIASMIQAVPDTKTPLQVKLDKLGKVLGVAALGICALIFLVGLLYKKPLLDMFMTAVSLAAAAIPEGLPAVSTIVLAVGVQRLVKKNAIVKTLPSVETLGSTQVICSDKTGTLTQNRMTVEKLYLYDNVVDISSVKSGGEFEPFKNVIQGAIFANDAILTEEQGEEITTGDPTETAMLDLGLLFGIRKPDLDKAFPRVAEIPFDSERKMMSTIHQDKEGWQVFAKGGLEEILQQCTHIEKNGERSPLTEEEKKSIREANLGMAEKALRVLAIATKTLKTSPEEIELKEIEKDLTFLGMLGMIDPPREEACEAVSKCVTAGIKPVMITGDHQITAVAIAESLGIKGKDDIAINGMELEKMSDEELRQKVEHIAVYARVSPEHKVRIVKAFQENNKIVAMTGDGVNDAPALKLADIGVAMGMVGTDVSKEAANVILTDDNFATIVTAVEEGRRIYDNILKAVQFMLSTNIGEITVLFVAVMANWAMPLLPIHILWINLVTDSLPALALSVDPASPDIMQRKPIDSTHGIMTKSFSLRIFLQGLMIGGLSITAFLIGMRYSVEIAQTMTFAVLAFAQVTHVFNVRSSVQTAFKGMFTNRLLLGALAIVIFLMLIVLEIPFLETIFHVSDLNWEQWQWVLALSIAPLPIIEIFKLGKRILGKIH